MTFQIKDISGKYVENVTSDSLLKTEISNILLSYDYVFVEQHKSGLLFAKQNSPAIFVDTLLFSLDPKTYLYVNYTSHQNQLMHDYQGLYRFVWSDKKSFIDDINIFITEVLDDGLNLAMYGTNRSLQHVDPTPPEFNFSVFFEQTFGAKSIHALQPEFNYTDKEGHRRFIDFVLETNTVYFAIELNGERYHHPLLIPNDKYRSQLFKQNSLVYDGYLVYRWSDTGMADTTKLAEQMRLFFGDKSDFKSTPHYRANRKLTFERYQHQTDAIVKINQQRLNGDNTFLVVLPTGTGKTEVFIEDVRHQLAINPTMQVLAIVPSRELRKQFVRRLLQQLDEVNIYDSLRHQDNGEQAIFVVTSAYILRHYHSFNREHFNYILVDEAHRAPASGLRNALAHFKPDTLLGLTATPDRTDQQQLETIFGQYDVDLTLEKAIEQGLVPPIRAYRLESNIDFSKVRFNGKEFVKQDLNKTVLTPSRNQLIVDVIKRYFVEPLIIDQPPKQGVIFCVDVKHTKAMAKLLTENGISSVAVDGRDREGIEQYRNGEVQFICACDLLNEGWDVPNTSVVVMARPTMSKVLYTQQLGRGTRKSKGKEALYVIDVVDAYGPALSPWSLHSLFGLENYTPFENVINNNEARHEEIITLDGLYEGERRLEPINIFNFEKEFGDLLNEEQLARELFITTGTLKSWIRKGDIQATKQLPFGTKTLNYFSEDLLPIIRTKKNLKLHTEQTRRDDFFEFLAQRDYTFSYKIIFMLIMLNHCNQRGEINLEDMITKYQAFYLKQLDRNGKADKDNSPYNNLSFLEDAKKLQSNLLANPFEKFERKRFIYQSKELNIISFDEVLWQKLTKSDINAAIKQFERDGKDYFEKLGMAFDPSGLASNIN